MEPQKRIVVVFYRTSAGNEPAREWLRSLMDADKRAIGEDIKVVEFSWPIGLPIVRKIDLDLWEVRSILQGRTARVIFTVWKNHMVLLHGFFKKTKKTPLGDLNIAKKRRNEILRGGIKP